MAAQALQLKFGANVFCLVLKFLLAKPGPPKFRGFCALALRVTCLTCDMKRKSKICASAQALQLRFGANLFCSVLKFLLAKPGPPKFRRICALTLRVTCLTSNMKNKIENLRGRSGITAQIWCKRVFSCLKVSVGKAWMPEVPRILRIGTWSNLLNMRYEKKIKNMRVRSSITAQVWCKLVLFCLEVFVVKAWTPEVSQNLRIGTSSNLLNMRYEKQNQKICAAAQALQLRFAASLFCSVLEFFLATPGPPKFRGICVSALRVTCLTCDITKKIKNLRGRSCVTAQIWCKLVWPCLEVFIGKTRAPDVSSNLRIGTWSNLHNM